MAAIAQIPKPASFNRRLYVRQKAHIPAYATVVGRESSDMLDLYEVLDVSESGVAIQCTLPLVSSEIVDLALDLAESDGQISTSARVAWFDSSGRVGLEFSPLTHSAVRQLREWLFLNAVAAASNAELLNAQSQRMQTSSHSRDDGDIFSAVSVTEREAESLGSDLEAVLSLVASRARSLLRASGAAIALEGKEVGTLVCRASSGHSAPPYGAIFQAGSGFSGECVRTGQMLRCDDTETDDLVNPQSCRALGIRSMLAAPVRTREKVIGLLEVFSAEPGAFLDSDSIVLSRLAEAILSALLRAKPHHDPPPTTPEEPTFPSASPGSVLFAFTPPKEPASTEAGTDSSPHEKNIGRIRRYRRYLLLLIIAALIALALGFILAKKKINASDLTSGLNYEHTVLASTKPPLESAAISTPKTSTDSANLAELQERATHGDPAAENALGLLYAQGDDKQAIPQNEKEAARFFMKAAEHGSIPAQSKLGSLYLSGRGLAEDLNRAYFWTVLARAGGDDASKVLAPFIATRLTLAQRDAIEQQAQQWRQQHESIAKASR